MKKTLVAAVTLITLTILIASSYATETSVCNGDFEDGVATGWERSYYAQVASMFGHSSSHSLGSPYDGQYHSFNAIYEFPALVNSSDIVYGYVWVFGGALTDAAHITWWDNDTGGEIIDVSNSGVPQEWTRYNFTFPAGLWVEGIQLDFTYQEGSGAGIWFDDVTIITNGTPVSGGTTPSPAGGGTTDWDTLIEGFTAFIVPLAVMLIPAVILGVVMKMGKWGVIIGLVIGTGLGYAFISTFPIWLVFLVTIAVVAVAYQSIKGDSH